jgi:hypothetical protein
MCTLISSVLIILIWRGNHLTVFRTTEGIESTQDVIIPSIWRQWKRWRHVRWRFNTNISSANVENLTNTYICETCMQHKVWIYYLAQVLTAIFHANGPLFGQWAWDLFNDHISKNVRNRKKKVWHIVRISERYRAFPDPCPYEHFLLSQCVECTTLPLCQTFKLHPTLAIMSNFYIFYTKDI